MKLQMMTHGQDTPTDDRVSPFYILPRSDPYANAVPIENVSTADQAFPVDSNCPVDLRQSRSSPTSQHEQPYYQQPSAVAMGCSSGNSLGQQPMSNVASDDLLLVEEHLRPLIKQELRYTIQSKRMARGLPSTFENERKESVVEEPSFETQLKRARRRERNKVAAAKCRFKKKMISEKLQEESEHLEHVNLTLKREIQKLQEERQKLIYILNLHRPTCIVRSPAASASHASTFLMDLSSNEGSNDTPGESSSHGSDANQSTVSPQQPTPTSSGRDWEVRVNSEQTYIETMLTTTHCPTSVTQAITTVI